MEQDKLSSVKLVGGVRAKIGFSNRESFLWDGRKEGNNNK